VTTTPARPVTTIRTQPRPQPPDWRHVFLEPAYTDGRPWNDPHDDGRPGCEDEEDAVVITT